MNPNLCKCGKRKARNSKQCYDCRFGIQEYEPVRVEGLFSVECEDAGSIVAAIIAMCRGTVS
jgi:hypothetical protein